MAVCSIKVSLKLYHFKLTFSIHTEIVSLRSSNRVATNSPKTSQMENALTQMKKQQTFSLQAILSTTKENLPRNTSSKIRKASLLATRTNFCPQMALRTATQLRQIASMRQIRAGRICCSVLETCKATKVQHQLQWLPTSLNMKRVKRQLILRSSCQHLADNDRLLKLQPPRSRINSTFKLGQSRLTIMECNLAATT